MALLDILDTLTVTTSAAVLALWARYEAGEIDEAMFLALTAAVINGAAARATVVADVSVAAELRRIGKLVRPAGIRPIPQQKRLQDAIRTILDMNADTPYEGPLTEPADRLGFLTKSEVIGAAQEAAGEAMKRHQVGWRRGLSPGACSLCTSWADGKVRSNRITMIRHHGCRCMPRPAVSE